jgi:ubiquinone/menaquinone biosynthesis C-methylase UbiE
MKALAEDATAKLVAVYDGAAATYNRIGPSFFLHFGKRLASVAGLQPGSQVLDVATGTGAVLVPAAQLVGSRGRVVGIDISFRMITRARSEIQNAGLRNSHVLVADARRLPIATNSFDCVLCSFAIFLFSNLANLLSECHRVLRSSGTLGLVYSAGEDENWTWYEQLTSKYKPTMSLGTERYRPEDVETALNRGGFEIISTTIERHRLNFANASEFWGWAWSHGDRAVLESLTGSGPEFKRELFQEFGRRAGTKGLPYHVFAAVTLGTRQQAG